MPIVADLSGNNPGNPATNHWTGVDAHNQTLDELERLYYQAGGASAFSKTLFALTTGLAWRTTLGTDNAANITSGVFNPARIPAINSSVQVISTSATIAGLSAPEQAQVVQGCVLTLTDGTRWIYSGSGSKTLQASYILLADVTPDWTVIANRPAVASTVQQLANTTGGSAGVGTDYAASDHAHPYPLGVVNAQTGTTYTIATSDHGKVVKVTNASAITVTLPNSLPAGFNCSVAQGGAGQITFSPQAGATMRNRSSFTKTGGQYAEVACRVDTNAGTAADWWVQGDMA